MNMDILGDFGVFRSVCTEKTRAYSIDAPNTRNSKIFLIL